MQQLNGACRLARSVLVVACLVSSGSVLAEELDQLAGQWQVKGWDHGDARDSAHAYEGQVTLSAQGESLLYEGRVDGLTYHGMGIWSPESETVSLYFMEEDTARPGVLQLQRSGEALRGPWVFGEDDGAQGLEVWTRGAKK